MCAKAACVACWVGTLNQLRCTVVDAGQGTLSFDGQTFVATAPIRAANGASVVAALRPEELHFGKFDGENQLTGKVEAGTFLGGIVRVRIVLGQSLITLHALNQRNRHLT